MPKILRVNYKRAAQRRTQVEGLTVQHFHFQPFKMGAAEVAQVIEPAQMETIKALDKKPLFKAFAIGHEGVVDGVQVTPAGKVLVKVQYLRDAVKKLYSALKVGTKIFQHHADTNSHAGREPIGSVVGKALKEVGGVLYDVVVTYIHPDSRDTKLNVASVETTVKHKTVDGIVQVDEIRDVTGIALADSDLESPGFPGASLLGAFQAFQQGKGEPMAPNIEEVIKLIEDGRWKPSDLFEEDELESDTIVKGLIKDKGRQSGGHASRLEKVLAKERDDRSKEVEKLQKENAGLKTQGLKHSAAGLLQENLKDSKLSDKQKLWVQRELKDWSPEEGVDDETALQKAITARVGVALDDFKVTAEIFGVKVEDGAAPQSQQKGPGAPPAGDSGGGAGDGIVFKDGADMTKPEDNPFMPDHEEAVAAAAKT